MCSDVLGQRSTCPLVKSCRLLPIRTAPADTSGVSGPVALRAGESITGMIGAGLASIDRDVMWTLMILGQRSVCPLVKSYRSLPIHIFHADNAVLMASFHWRTASLVVASGRYMIGSVLDSIVCGGACMRL